MTGPIIIEGAVRGDVLAVEIPWNPEQGILIFDQGKAVVERGPYARLH